MLQLKGWERLSCKNWGKISNGNHINHAFVLHYLIYINADIYVSRNLILQFKTLLMVNVVQHNITTVYFTTLTYERNTFDLKSIPSQADITVQ